MIEFHCDVSNKFYAMYLKRRMQYFSAVFSSVHEDLDTAQRRKLELICTKLQLKPGMRLLDIGCGWGGLAGYAAEHHGAIVHGVTLSAAQLVAAKAHTERFGDRVTLELRDYRTLDDVEVYDAIAQIGMFEHIGINNYDAFSAQMARLLRHGGLPLHQATTPGI